MHRRAPVMVQALVEEGEQQVEGRAAGFEALVEEGNLDFGHAPVGEPAVLALGLVGFQIDRPKQLVGGQEARRQILEEAQARAGLRVHEAGSEGASHLALGRPRRAEQDNVLAGEQRHERRADRVLALEEHAVEVRFDVLKQKDGVAGGVVPLGSLAHTKGLLEL